MSTIWSSISETGVIMKMFLRMLLISTGVGDENNAPPSPA
ncbi:hypothetical protein EC2735000_3300 [Escherichia coli 2735000]|nr:hypothetical protein ECBCE019MS13_4936 [Escherichia coli BCE019_MS-13]EMV70679.1 hypothetical protein EC2866450_3370 [Escherichia coli 2866450]EMV74153.1 hypothetical protein EC2866750_3393 [Escherichia coli 2866750]EMW59669.1 hypothetical protein EC2756500_3358 [Escherichia coli 2756500]EMX27080.1 hypothetical protein ECMP0215661_0174 [Escherichia coli MP021566.1]EMZ66268.1 hypothetical protein EC2735000_3300 [Escherichia coli 2735000]ENA61890.1 hypothetical protein EC179550_3180 [Escheri